MQDMIVTNQTPRGSRQMCMQTCPSGSLPAKIKSIEM